MTERKLSASWTFEEPEEMDSQLPPNCDEIMSADMSKKAWPYRYRLQISTEMFVACGDLMVARGNSMKEIAQDYVNHMSNWSDKEGFRGWYTIGKLESRDDRIPADYKEQMEIEIALAYKRGKQPWPVIKDSAEDRMHEMFADILQEEVTKEIDQQIIDFIKGISS